MGETMVSDPDTDFYLPIGPGSGFFSRTLDPDPGRLHLDTKQWIYHDNISIILTLI